jgi:hypothetical protein
MMKRGLFFFPSANPFPPLSGLSQKDLCHFDPDVFQSGEKSFFDKISQSPPAAILRNDKFGLLHNP